MLSYEFSLLDILSTIIKVKKDTTSDLDQKLKKFHSNSIGLGTDAVILDVDNILRLNLH